MTVVLDYGMGNLRSVEKAIQHLGQRCEIQDSLRGASKLIIPGVGAFGAAMDRLEPLKGEIKALARSGVPVLGICLGQQLLFEASDEFGTRSGLELLGGRARYFPRTPGLKIPHMGWNVLIVKQSCPMNSGLHDGDQVYFVHSLYTECSDPADVAATSEHGIVFPASVWRDNIWGTQFHPEKSGAIGLLILKNFLAC